MRDVRGGASEHGGTREVALEGELSDEQRERLLVTANRCPVHRTLTSEIKVRSYLSADGGE